MDGGLNGLGSPRRRFVFVLVVALVALLHVLFTRELAERLAAAARADAMPARLAVAYVRVVEPAPPPAVAPAAVAPSPPPRAPARARAPRVARAASAVAALDESSRLAAEEAATEAAWRAAVAAVDARVERSRQLAEAAAASAAQAAAAAREDEERVQLAAAAAAAASTLASASTAASASAAGGLPFEWPASTRVSYVLTGSYRGEVSGSAQVEWVRLGSRYQVNYDFLVGPDFAPLISRRATSTGRIEPEGLVPERYDEETKVVFRRDRRMSVVFEPETVVLANGDRKERLAGVQDTASQFIQLTYLFTTHPERLRVGEKIEFPLALPRTMNNYTYEVVGEETLHMPFGPLQAFHLKPRRAVKKANALDVEIWFAPSLRYLPVRIRVEQDEANFVDMLIQRKPEMAAS